MSEGEKMEKEDFINLEAPETNAFVRDVVKKMWDVGMESLKPIDPRQRYLLWSRIVTYLFSQNFYLTISATEEIIEKAQGEK